MKKILKKGLISILIVLIVFNFMSASAINVVYCAGEDEMPSAGDFIGGLFSGLVGLITWIPRAIAMAALMGLNKLMTTFAIFGLDGIDGYGFQDRYRRWLS